MNFHFQLKVKKKIKAKIPKNLGTFLEKTMKTPTSPSKCDKTIYSRGYW